jgi:hypothetical protein
MALPTVILKVLPKFPSPCQYALIKYGAYKQADTLTHKQADIKTDRQIQRQACRQTDTFHFIDTLSKK